MHCPPSIFHLSHLPSSSPHTFIFLFSSHLSPYLSQGIEYLISRGVLDNCPLAIADFIHHTQILNWRSLDKYLQSRPDVLDCLVQLQGYAGMFLPDALRAFFSRIPAPNERGRFLESLLDKFSTRFVQCNIRTTTMSKGGLIVMHDELLISKCLSAR